ncbi:SBF-like CPA transporter family-domain-containing protein [Mucor lusitanicus]|uniref:SBF-like CPA transporter family-domain-containing protein n=2 Tax=Mucor circinelloides f. lusitanicus TaxID=29924 RepID=A0A8H4BJ18_MUCCL|nr:SBF-like CPA transporter family-domain-containing protein [Mucor lusitanicus]
MSAPPKRPPSIIAPSFTSDVTFSTLTRPFELQLSHLGKTKSGSFSLKSETSLALPPIETTTTRSSIDAPADQEESKLKKTLNRVKSIAKSAFLKYWFLLGLVIAILLAWQFPNVGRKGGYIRAEWSIKWGAVVVIFLISGLSLRTRILAQTLLRVRLHFLIQLINLIMIPFFVFGLILLFFKLHMPVNSLLLIGVVIAASTPTTVSSNVVMTKNANGNEASALMNAALGNVLGIFVSPALVSYFQGPLLAASPEDESANTAGGSVDFVMVLKQLGLTVLLPLVIGQAIQILFTEPVAKFKVKCRLSDVSSFCLLLMVWSVFSDAVHAGSFSAVAGKDIAAVVILNFLFYILFSVFSFALARLPYSKRIFGPLKWLDRLRYSREDTVAVMYCGATKTVAMGVPLINVLYQKGDPGTIGVLSTPLLLYHVEQLILGNIEVEILKKWVSRGKKRDEQKVRDQAAGMDDEEDQQQQQQTSTTSTTSVHLNRDEENAYESGVTKIEPYQSQLKLSF